jgi:predicted glycosyltransferase
VLGVPAIFISTTGRGYTDEQESRYGIVVNFKPAQQEACINAAIELAQRDLQSIREDYQAKRSLLLQNCTDITKWIVEFVENLLTSNNHG